MTKFCDSQPRYSPYLVPIATEQENFLGQASARLQSSISNTSLTSLDIAPNPPPQPQAEKQGYFSSILSSLPNPTLSRDTSQPPQQQQQQQQQQPTTPQKQSYFTSILSSLPNLSLSSLTGDDSSKVPQSQPEQQQQDALHSASQQGYNVGAHETAPLFYGQSHHQGLGDFNAGTQPLHSLPPNSEFPPGGGPSYNFYQVPGDANAPATAPPLPLQPQQPPPTTLPPSSAGAGSYRLGNQRRLKYAPTPDLTSVNPSRQQFQPAAVPAFLPVPNVATPPNFLNPSIQNLVPSAPHIGSHSPSSAPLPSTATSSQGSSLHSSFRSSPVTNSPAGYLGGPPVQIPAYQPVGHLTAPQSIPNRLSEPATPQNTPADVAFSGFNIYRQQQQTIQEAHSEVPTVFNFNEVPRNTGAPPLVVGQFEAVKEVTADVDKTFTPISAAKVTEKLENLIAEQNDDTLSVKSELSAEVAKITAKIPTSVNQGRSDQLTEIDLNSTTDLVTLTDSSEVKFDLSSEISGPSPHQQQQTLATFTASPAKNFFTNPVTNSQNASHFYNSLFPIQEPLADPFSFVQTTAPVSNPVQFVENTPKQSESLTTSTPILPPVASDPRLEEPKHVAATGNVELTQQPIWGSSQTEQQHSVISNPAYPPTSQPGPAFFNPTQFQNSPQQFQPTSFIAQVPPQVSQIGSNPSCQLPSALPKFNALPEPSGSATLSPVQISVNPLTSRSALETVPPSLQKLAAGLPIQQMQYRPVYHHWFYRREVEAKTLWLPFSMHDSLNLENFHNSNEISPETKVPTDGGRYDVEILRRQRSPVYWTGPTTEVRRCSWFHKGSTESRYTPYEESVAARIEEEYKQAYASNNWNRRVDLNNGEYIVFHNPSLQVHYLQATTPEVSASWSGNADSEDHAYLQGAASRLRVVKRGMDEFNIEDGEPEKVDHLLFLVHGIGSVCDLKFRSVEEVVDGFRSISLQLLQSHYRSSSEQGIVNRIEVLPISWHATLHSGIDKKLQVVTLGSIPKLRHFTNDTLLDILLYTSPVYCETITQAVVKQMNELYSLFKQRNPDFRGSVYLGGHSLGSLILFDLLCHQKPPAEEEAKENRETKGLNDSISEDPSTERRTTDTPVMKRKLSKKVSYVIGTAGTGQPYINYPQLSFHPRALFALGSPIGMFVTVRGIDTLGENFVLPTCPAFFNIFHPFDPVAYRVESLVNSEAHKYRPMLIPHHKGRKRMHLELKETMARVGADLKQRLMESVRSTWNSVYQLTMFHKPDNQELEQEIEKVVEEQMNTPAAENPQESADDGGADLKIGKLNGGRRIDYVLQEAPFEYINEYIFALMSHVCYWESEDTMLLILKEIYGSMGIQTDAQLPQQTLSIERVSTPTVTASPAAAVSPTGLIGMDPTAPVSSKPVGPPPVAGFVRNS